MRGVWGLKGRDTFSMENFWEQRKCASGLQQQHPYILFGGVTLSLCVLFLSPISVLSKQDFSFAFIYKTKWAIQIVDVAQSVVRPGAYTYCKLQWHLISQNISACPAADLLSKERVKVTSWDFFSECNWLRNLYSFCSTAMRDDVVFRHPNLPWEYQGWIGFN